MQGYERDPRSVAKRAEAYLKSTGIADTAFFGPEPEFFIFDDIRWGADMSGLLRQDRLRGGRLELRARLSRTATSATVRASRAATSRCRRSTPCTTSAPPCAWRWKRWASPVEVHHHEVATAGQCEIGTRFNTLVQAADEVQILKYVRQNVAHSYGKTAPSCPSPWSATTAAACTCTVPGEGRQEPVRRQPVRRPVRDRPVLHRRHHQARPRPERLHQPSTNSYKRLVPGFEAPVMLAYSARNRSASIRIPYVSQSRRPPHRGALPGSRPPTPTWPSPP
jgi:glutamine synthetase